MSADDEIRLERRGGLIVVTLNRPRALNALSLRCAARSTPACGAGRPTRRCTRS